MRVLAGTAAALVVLAAGCGGSSSSDESKTTTAAVRPLRGLAPFKACVKRAGAKVEHDPPTLDGRVAVGAAGNLPATYVGAVVWPNDAYMDVWFADNAADGAATADKVNEAEAQREGVTEVEQAFNSGRIVAAPGATDAFGNLANGRASKIDDCLAAADR